MNKECLIILPDSSNKWDEALDRALSYCDIHNLHPIKHSLDTSPLINKGEIDPAVYFYITSLETVMAVFLIGANTLKEEDFNDFASFIHNQGGHKMRFVTDIDIQPGFCINTCLLLLTEDFTGAQLMDGINYCKRHNFYYKAYSLTKSFSGDKHLRLLLEDFEEALIVGADSLSTLQLGVLKDLGWAHGIEITFGARRDLLEED